FDYVLKPFSPSQIDVILKKAQSYRQLLKINRLLSDDPDDEDSVFVGRSPAIVRLRQLVERVAPTDATVLITGESGTGKELVARAVHANSRRASRPFVSVNCAAISETLLESELFGHVRGAFTGAVSARKGLFEEANGGTFFFDEIAETPPSFQAKLLRAIQEGEIRRLGDNKPIHVDVRIVAATNQDLKLAIEEKRFRQDLYYRLNVARFILPPLRERREDIPQLVEHFLDKFSKKMNRHVVAGDGVLDYLLRYDFPGNIRELENMIEQGVALALNGVVQRDDVIPPEVQLARPRADPARGLPASASDSSGRSLQDVVDEAERKAIEAMLREVDGNKERAAELLGLSSTTLWRKMKRLNVTWPS
ncbi:MAG TPA: sigma-54 dependent transcriptional regulator, partial [Polyangiaceae bacterium]|nr:sigma-54 dependent transcriptional regulator [Polyangiaceae bacterium]